MLPIKLRDLALLSCSFSERDHEQGESKPEQGADYLEEQLLQLAATTELEDEDIVCFIEGKLDDDRLPFELSFEIAFLFEVPGDNSAPAVEEIQPTLIWVAFPHLREFIANITGRSAFPQYFLPPLTRLPHPDHAAKEPGESPETSESAG